jgi:hypothetical protein
VRRRPGGSWLALAAVSAPLLGRAQTQPSRPRNVVTLQPLSLITGYIDLEYERTLSRRFSAYVAPGAIFSRGRRLDGSNTAGVFGWSVDLGGRWYPFGEAPSGLFADLSAGVFTSTLLTSFGERGRGLGGRGMLLGGYTFVLGGHLVLSGALGVQVTGFDRESGTGIQWSVLPALRVALGFAL